MKTKSTYLVVLMTFFLIINTEFSFGQSIGNQTRLEANKLEYESKYKDIEKKANEDVARNEDNSNEEIVKVHFSIQLNEEEAQNKILLKDKRIEELSSNFEDSFNFLPDNPVSCTGSLSPFTDVRRGKITSEIIIAKDYYLDPRNQEGTLEERMAKVKIVIKKVFTEFVTQRTAEYRSVKCHYRGIDWNKPGGSSWKTITCQPGFYFIEGSLRKTQNGDWKGGPVWAPDYSTLSWKTGGHRRSETFAEVDAEYYQVDNKVLEELNSARKILHDLGIPTEYP